MYQIVNANVYIKDQVSGKSTKMLGKVKECTLPNVTFTQAEHRALGMVGTVQYFSGIEAMEATITWTAIYPDTLASIGNPRKAVELSLYSNLEEVDTATGLTSEKKLLTVIRGTIKSFPLGTFTPGEIVSDATTNMAIHYIRQNYGDKDFVEIDVFSNTFKVNGEDVLKTYKSNLGI
nr:phage major tail tube protein [bacterium]